MRKTFIAYLLLAACCWTGTAQAAGPGISPHQAAACRDAVRDLEAFRDMDAEDLIIRPDRIDKRGRAVIEWKVQARRLRAEGFCRVEPNGFVAEVKVKEVDTPPRPRPLDGITMDVDTSRHGKPYSEFETRGPEECARACLAAQRCQAYNYRVSAQVCKLKENFHETDRERGTISGEKVARAPVEVEVEMEIERDRFLVGDAYKDFIARDLKQCRRACESERRCIGFNYHTDDGACGLKDYIEKRRHREGIISGEKINLRR